MIEDLEENSNKSLADNEIASLMKTLASKNYKEDNSFPKKIIEPFKPTSLFEIAQKNVSKRLSNNENTCFACFAAHWVLWGRSWASLGRS